ncbi:MULTISPECIES: hypothetical protein [unclassified Saccharicrinis]|uniref:hypothetical protein n=1 Tax=unclassified Saccharicrinis TaxID=2646859 RepID=UPI003D328461
MKTLNQKFYGRRELNAARKKAMYIGGIILSLIGMYGVYKSDFELFSFWSILTLGGILNIIQSKFGKELIKEKNFISLRKEEIEYKNSFKKPHKIKIEDLLDLRIETAKVEFVQHDQRVESYDFSVFQKQELDTIHKELERIKSNIKK